MVILDYKIESIPLCYGKEKCNMKKYSRLIGIRNQCGLSQQELSEHINCSYASYNAKENGKVKFTADDMAKIRDVLSDKLGYTLTIDDLFF